MTHELKPKIWEFRIREEDNPDLVLEYRSNDKSIHFLAIEGALEQIVGVEFVLASLDGTQIKVVARNVQKVYNQIRETFGKMYGFMPFPYWRNSEIVDAQL